MSKSIKLNTFYKTVLNVCNIIFPLLTAPYIARVLSVDGFTECNRVTSVISWFSPFAVFGVYTYGLRTISQVKNNKIEVEKLFSSLFFLSVLFSAITTIAYFLLIYASPFFKDYIGLYIIGSSQLLFTCFANDWMNEASENYGFILVKSFVCKLIYVLSVFSFIKKANDAYLYILFTSISVILNNLLTFAFNKWRFKFRKIDLLKTFKLIKPLFIVFLLVNSSMLYTMLDRFFLTYFTDKMELTFYHISQVLSNSVVQVTSSVIMVSIPRLSYFWGSQKKEAYYDLLKKSSSLFSVLSFPCCMGMAFLSTEIIYLYSGEKYLAGNVVLFAFCIRYLISNFDSIFAKQILLPTNNENSLTKIYYTAGIYNLLAKGILLYFKKLSALTCIVSTTTADILVVILQIIEIKKKNIKNVVFSKDLIIPLLVSVLFSVVIFIIHQFLIPENIKNVILISFLSVSICSILYFAALLATKNKILLSFMRSRK